MAEGYIAFFDSGIGGLHLLLEFHRRCPWQPSIYFGDNENAPYGGRGEDEILRLARAAFEKICRFPVRAAVIACNTVTAECVDILRREHDFPIVGIEPAVRPAVRFVREGDILLLATRATLASARVRKLVSGIGGRSAIIPYCPANLAGDIEKAAPDFSGLDVGACLPQGKFAAAVLGCTHYIFLASQIARRLNCPVFDGVAGTVDHLLQIANICSKNPPKIDKISPIFIGNSKNKNRMLFEELF